MTAVTKVGDGTPWVFTLNADLTGADEVRLKVARSGALIVDEVVTGSADGVVERTPDASDVDRAATLRAELEVWWPGWAMPQHFPAVGYASIRVYSDLR